MAGWALAAQVGIGALQSWLGGRTQSYIARQQQHIQESQAYMGGINEIRQLSKMLEYQGNQNQSIMKADIESFRNMNYNAGIAGLQDALSKRIATENSSIVRRSGAVALAENAANAAATGTLGASADAVLMDVQRNVDKGITDIAEQRVIERDNIYQGLYGLYTNYHQTQQEIDDSLPDVPENPRIYSGYVPKNNFINHLAGSALNVGVGYLGSYMQLGLGNKQTTPQTGQGGVTLYGIRR